MKKTILFLLCGVFAAGVAKAEELVIQLKSGNSITIQYTGSIQGVTMNGATDGIAGVSMTPAANAASAPAQARVPEQKAPAPSASPQAGEKKASGSGVRFHWAEPVRED